MALAAERAISAKQIPAREKIVDFSPERLRAPFVLRIAALAIDYIAVVIIPVLWLVLSRLMSELGTDASIGLTPWLIAIVIFIANFIIFPAVRGRTFGKLLVGLTILNIDGTRVNLLTIVRRNVLGYLFTIVTFGVGFLVAAFNASGRSLHDYIAGTVVVHGRKTQS
jgi:uncharacterized RDD family membrane protein YckC